MTAGKKKTREPGPLGRLRRRAEALLKKSPRAFSHASVEDAQNLIHELRVHQVFTTPGKQACELEMRSPDGAAFSGRLETILETPGPDQRAQCLVALTDVTKRRKAETERAALAAIEKARLAVIVESSDDAIISRSLDDIAGRGHPPSVAERDLC